MWGSGLVLATFLTLSLLPPWVLLDVPWLGDGMALMALTATLGFWLAPMGQLSITALVTPLCDSESKKDALFLTSQLL